MPVRELWAFDYDGTFTNVEKEGVPFVRGYSEDLQKLTKLSIVELSRRYAQRSAAMIDGDDPGWLMDGHIAAPARVDPYLRMSVFAGELLDEFALFMDPHDRKVINDYFFETNYALSDTCLLPGVDELLEAVIAKSDTVASCIITNARTHSVEAKLATIGMAGRVDLLGNAMKFLVGDEPAGIPATMRIPGLDRPVYLRRHLYYKALDDLRRGHGLEWSQVTVIGDIAEMDLLLALALGARVGLMANKFTPNYEIAYLRAHLESKAVILHSVEDMRRMLGL